MSHARHDYLPAAGRDIFLPLYDPLVKLLGADRARRRLFDQAAVQPRHRILDIGCGTGTFAVAIKRWLPTADVVGLELESILSWMSQAGLGEPRSVASDQELFGKIAYYQARAPG